MAEDVEKVGTDPMEFKTQQLPLARIKKVRRQPNCHTALQVHRQEGAAGTQPVEHSR